MLALTQEDVFRDFADRVQLAGATVAELGGAFPLEMLGEADVKRWYSIDPNRPAGVSECGRRHVLTAPGESIPLPDRSVDAVFSCNALQFIDVDRAFREVERVLRPGGVAYAHFGPIWSGPDGHQLEYVTHEGRPLRFWEDTYLPAWSHLEYDRAELLALLQSGLESELAALLVWHVHDSPTINRLFFEDYIRLAEASGLVIEAVATSSELDYEIQPPRFDAALLREPDLASLEARVSAARGAATQLGVRDVRMLLRRR